jgi:hypothetical protein
MRVPLSASAVWARAEKRAGGLAGPAWQADAHWATRLGRVRRSAVARACWGGNSSGLLRWVGLRYLLLLGWARR